MIVSESCYGQKKLLDYYVMKIKDENCVPVNKVSAQMSYAVLG